jgi:hypothetical protein
MRDEHLTRSDDADASALGMGFLSSTIGLECASETVAEFEQVLIRTGRGACFSNRKLSIRLSTAD